MTPARSVERVEEFGHGAAGLAQRRDVAAQSRHPELQRLDHREPETFREGRQQQRARTAQQRHQRGVGQRVVLDDGVSQRRAAIEHVDDVFDLPTALPDQYQERGPIAKIAGSAGATG